ncbi:ankyrin repeat domain-containing protein [Pontibacter beigongshangensis]|uniref:ankyrin repeat domain-containing protein n=1 Tax=Pontibacter beigongshangensis TaxID=2574733 RepID=UPI00164F22AA|nr:ankyrin repeat domain-containing protein [Pontibacter beigongshangensis]
MKNLLLLLFLFSLHQHGLAQAFPPGMTPVQKTVPVNLKAAVGWRSPETQEAVALYIALQHEAAYAKFREAVANGDSDAYYFMGRMQQHRELRSALHLSDSVELKNPEVYFAANRDSARYYYQKAVRGNCLLGHLGLAELMTLKSVDDEEQFKRHMKSASVDIKEKAAAGDAFCNRILGSMFYNGFGEREDKAKAFQYFNKAAAQNDVVSYGYLGSLYMEGEGVAKDRDKAFYWFKKGAEAGDREASYSLGLFYEEGQRGKSDLREALKWYKRAMEKGSMMAYEQLKQLDESPESKLLLGAMDRNPDLIARAVELGANVNCSHNPQGFDIDFKGRTPLMHALYLPHLMEGYGTVYHPEVRLEAFRYLLQHGADIHQTDEDGKTPLMFVVSGTRVNSEAFEKEQLHLLDTLIALGADPNTRDLKGNTALMYVLEFGKGQGMAEIQRLLEAGAEINAQNEEGKSALMLACDLNLSNEMILLLLSAGADPKLLDKAGKAAIQFTRRDNIRNMLLAAGSPEF